MKWREMTLQVDPSERIWSLRLTLDQTKVLIKVDKGEIEKFYYPLSSFLLDRLTPPARLLVVIAGPPGCGKTAFCTVLEATINASAGVEIATCIGLDGWQFPNAYLDSHFTEHNGQRVLLKSIKGAPQTYDVQAVHRCLKRIRNYEKVSFPVYSRKMHDPVPDAGIVELHHRIILAEGNYWLLNEKPWKDFQFLFDVTIFITAPPECLVKGLRKRHLRGGKNSKVVEEYIQKVDLPNIEHVLSNSLKADVVVHKIDNRRIAKIIFP
jgi:pantothenate kinase